MTGDYSFRIVSDHFETESVTVHLGPAGTVCVACHDSDLSGPPYSIGITIGSREFLEKLLELYIRRLDAGVDGLTRGLDCLRAAGRLLADVGYDNTRINDARDYLQRAVSQIESVLK